MPRQHHHTCRAIPLWVALAIAVGFTAGAWQPAYASDDARSDRMLRQVTLMEKVLDHVLKESPYWLVSAGDPTHGLYLEEFGVLYSFDASLVRGDWGRKEFFDFSFFDRLRVESDDGRIIIWTDEDDLDELYEEEEEIAAEAEDRAAESGGETVIDLEDPKDHKRVIAELERRKQHLRQERQERVKKEGEQYAAGKEELIDALLDYGETLTALDDDQWVAIAVFLGENDYFQREELSRLVLKVRMRHLRDYAAAHTSREELIEQMVVEEY